MAGDIVVPEIVSVIGALMRIVIDRATAEAVEMIIAALQWTEFRQTAEVPFADQRRAVSGLPQQRRQRGVIRW